MHRLTWVTHLPAPYRIPVFRALQRRWDLEIHCTERDSRIGSVGSRNRGDDWRADHFPDLDFRELRTARVHWRDVPLYILLPGSRARRVRASDVILIGGWEVPAYWQYLLMAKFRRVPTVGFYESPAATNTFSRGPVRHARAWFLRQLNAVVTPGEAATESLRQMGLRDERIFQGFNAVDVEYFWSRAQQSTRSPHVGRRYLYVGQLIQRKRVRQLLEHFLRSASPEDTLTFVGAGEQQATLEEDTARLGASGRVSIRPQVPNDALPEIYAEHDVLCLVSEREVWGLVVNEALASGLSVIVTEGAGVAASVHDMPGVHIVSDDLSNLGDTFAERPERPAVVPPILRHTPQRFAEVFSQAFDFALTSAGRSRL